MDIIYLLIPLALIFVAVAVWAFFWAVDDGQYDDLESPSHSILFDQEPSAQKTTTSISTSENKAND
ncbi:cbb3-type cytochrome oxidase assembly protein CcoS [Zooshikella marina]|uniref:Cbb3-type cytochrome oxidase assembly protein CcoS n=1 Tax=Zooshikella ganghwensis TaxID=202772 RepID=A0A4P9VJ43_9GAMM|nr:cbb3-type cytochrome oxidase assembly protein CcoS [Zooshikella ganghwensis]MBU2704534.1 cbb3-type cytochrome oxidase assembly protein CcoS [Zooshikella ganghwensis]RDH43278.1 cbb3-type cytochrome oxidase assembly protein CcoS [Zooshikella ganghwensis]